MKYLIFILLLNCVCSCRNPSVDPALQASINEVKKLIDSDSFPQKYVLLSEFVNKTGRIYLVENQDAPLQIGTWLPPTQILPYKGKYICIMSPFADKLMSKKELENKYEYSSQIELGMRDETIYHLGISKDGRKTTVLPMKCTHRNSFRSYMYPSLLEYMFDGYSSDKVPRFVNLEFSTIQVDTTFRPGDELNEHILYLYGGEIFFSDSCDVCLTMIGKEMSDSFFATVNGKDTLKYIIDGIIDSHLMVSTERNSDFFKHLLPDSTECTLYALIRDSTFYVEKSDNGLVKTPVLAAEMELWYNVMNDSCEVMTFYTKGVSEWNLESFTRWNE